MSKVFLKNIAEIQSGPFGTQLHKDEYVEKGVLMLNAKNIGNGVVLTESVDYVSESVCSRLSQYVLREGDILFGRAGSIERHTYIDKRYDGCFQGTNCIRIRCNNQKLSRFVSYYLWFPIVKRRIENQTGGSILSYITTDLLKEVEINLPDELTVDRITKTLVMIDSKIQNNEAINDNLQQQLKLMYDYWFTQFDFPNKDGSPYRSSGGQMAPTNGLSYPIPVDWRIETVFKNRLSSIIKPGVMPFTTKTYLATAEVNGTSISTGNTVDFETRESRANMQPTENSVWFAKMKKSIKHLYLNPAMKPLIEESILSTGFCGLKCSEYSFEYIASFIEHSYFETLKDTLAHGATQEAVNNDDLAGIALVIPPDEVLSLYHERAKGIYTQMSKNICENQELIRLRDWLLPMLMNGQATVSD